MEPLAMNGLTPDMLYLLVGAVNYPAQHRRRDLTGLAERRARRKAERKAKKRNR